MLNLREMQIKLMVRYNFIRTRIVIMKKIIISVGEDVEKLEPS